MPARYLVGIDLGTTHTVVASVEPPERGARPSSPVVFPVPQLVSEEEIEACELYASSLYAPLEAEAARVPNVCGDAPWITGALAKRRGTEVPGRVVTSAKSWLCHPGVDRLAPILPWGSADETLARLSPVDASARILAHVRRAWDEAHPDAPLFEQDIVLTVPASFDEAARELTVQAAERAGLEVRLLEEPLAAFYDFLGRTPTSQLVDMATRAGGEAFVLVVDVGGGTTDLSLLAVRHAFGTASTPSAPRPGGTDGPITVERVAVGRHLLLGGDNMDLALAHACEARLVESGQRLEPARFAQLTSACRSAKEHLLAEDAASGAVYPIAIAGVGSKLVGSTLRTELSRDEVEHIVLDGFFPIVGRDERPSRARGALVAFGLPYERDVAITRHITEFVARHVPEGARVHALLLNGGVFRAARTRARIAELFASFGEKSPEVLPQPDPDLAVALGAVAYGLALRGFSLRIAAGAARGYYIGVETNEAGVRKAMCVVPRGAAEESLLLTAGEGLSLVVGKPVRFDLFVSDDAPTDQKPGDVVVLDDDYERAPPLTVRFPSSAQAGGAGGDRSRDESVAVDLEGKLTSVGTLELACVERAGTRRRFRLAFQLRMDADGDTAPPAPVSELPRSLRPSRAASSTSIHTKRGDEAKDAIDRAFGKPRPDASRKETGGREAKDLVRELERIMGERATWNMETARELFDTLAPLARARRRSADHERVFWMLAGYCLRPGFGDVGDEARVAILAPLFSERLAFPDETRSWSQFFIAWRRIAAGLDEEAQTKIRDFVDPFLAPPEAGLKKPKKPKLEADFDMLELAVALERVPATRRAALGGWIIERTWTERDPRLWAALGRIGARVPSYASAHHVVSPLTAERWIDHLLREKWEGLPTAPRAALALGRRTGDRARDLSERLRQEIARRLQAIHAPPEWSRALEEVVALTDEDRRDFFGESFPVGLQLLSRPS